jgi:hypothetical protein
MTLHQELHVLIRIKPKAVPTPTVLYVTNTYGPPAGHTKFLRDHR